MKHSIWDRKKKIEETYEKISYFVYEAFVIFLLLQFCKWGKYLKIFIYLCKYTTSVLYFTTSFKFTLNFLHGRKIIQKIRWNYFFRINFKIILAQDLSYLRIIGRYLSKIFSRIVLLFVFCFLIVSLFYFSVDPLIHYLNSEIINPFTRWVLNYEILDELWWIKLTRFFFFQLVYNFSIMWCEWI